MKKFAILIALFGGIVSAEQLQSFTIMGGQIAQHACLAQSMLVIVAGTTPGGGGGAITLLDHKFGSFPSGTGTATTGSMSCTGANFMVMNIAIAQGGGFNNPADSLGNTYAQAGSWQNTGTDGANGIFYVANPTVSGAMTVSDSDLNVSIEAACFSNVPATVSIDQSNGAVVAGSGTTIQAGSITPTVGNTLVIAGLGFHAASTVSIGSGFTITDTVNATGTSSLIGGSLAYFVQSVAAAINPTWTLGTAQTEKTAVIANFK